MSDGRYTATGGLVVDRSSGAVVAETHHPFVVATTCGDDRASATI